jgi:hypothetical protein
MIVRILENAARVCTCARTTAAIAVHSLCYTLQQTAEVECSVKCASAAAKLACSSLTDVTTIANMADSAHELALRHQHQGPISFAIVYACFIARVQSQILLAILHHRHEYAVGPLPI